MKVDTSVILWTKTLKQQSSELNSVKNNRFESLGSETLEIYVDKSQNHTKKY